MSRWQKYDILIRMERVGLVPTVNAPSVDDYLHIADALKAGGLPIIEVLVRVQTNQIPRIHLDAVYELRKRFGGEMLVGAGTIQTPERAQVAIDNGAQFVVSNLTSPAVIAVANHNDILMIPGARDDSQILIARGLGCQIIKLFIPQPTSAPEANLAYLQQFFNIYPRLQFVLTGGITPENVGSYLGSSVPFVVPGELITPEIIKDKSWKLLTARTQKYLQAVAAARVK
jgi:2-dehydro-3-deoxyphosphogluconate aldolase/(4S)-4-hydroxy-2-oxoglutarate aldolase